MHLKQYTVMSRGCTNTFDCWTAKIQVEVGREKNHTNVSCKQQLYVSVKLGKSDPIVTQIVFKDKEHCEISYCLVKSTKAFLPFSEAI